VHQCAPICILLVHCTNKVHTQKVGAVGANLDGKQTKVMSTAPTCTNICAFLVFNKTEPEYGYEHGLLPYSIEDALRASPPAVKNLSCTCESIGIGYDFDSSIFYFWFYFGTKIGLDLPLGHVQHKHACLCK